MSAVDNTTPDPTESTEESRAAAARVVDMLDGSDSPDTPALAARTPALTSFGPETDTALPTGTEHWLVQMKRYSGDGTTQFSVYVHNGVCIDGGETQQRWLFKRRTSWVDALRWMQKQGAHGKLYRVV